MSAPRPLTARDVATVCAALARSMVDDPGWIHVFPDQARRLARLDRLFGLAARKIFLRGGTSWAVGDHGVVGAALWDAPGAHRIPALTVLSLLPRLALLIGRRTPIALDMFRQMERRHPTEPHYYLAVLGIDPAHQGHGLGPRLLAPVLERCDDARVLAWLESTNPRNHSFYLRSGFEVADRHAVADGPTITFFARRPR